jgi:hypothetical protein
MTSFGVGTWMNNDVNHQEGRSREWCVNGLGGTHGSGRWRTENAGQHLCKVGFE